MNRISLVRSRTVSDCTWPRSGSVAETESALYGAIRKRQAARSDRCTMITSQAMTKFIPAIQRVAWGLACLSLCSCAPIEHSRELQLAQARMEHATGLRPAWEVDTPLRELPLQPGDVLTLPSAIELTLTNNRSLRADLEVIGQAKADLVQAGLLSNPVLSTMLRFPSGGGLPDFAFGLSKDFADLWLIPSRKRAAQAMLQQRVLSLADTATMLVAEVKIQYAMAQYQRLAEELLEQNLAILRNAMEIADARLRAASGL
jgi:cobalt-zinc-cadmium efflux system outer membrane protein